MNKDELSTFLSTCSNSYTWSMYFFKIDRRNQGQPYTMHKVRFKNSTYLTSYVSDLIVSLTKFQLNPVSDIQDYDGLNTKVSCDCISTTNQLLSSQWSAFSDSIANATDKDLKGRIHGYVICGQPINELHQPIIFAKTANPIINLKNKRSIVYQSTINGELDTISDTTYRFYLTVDFIVYQQNLYAFSHSFESLFNMEETMKKVKTISIDKISAVPVFANLDQFKQFANSYKSPRTFITLNEKRLERIKNARSRVSIAKRFGLALDAHNDFVINNEKEAALLIKYLCYKIFFDDETKDILEASTVIRIELGV